MFLTTPTSDKINNDVTGRKLGAAKIVARLPNWRGLTYAARLPINLHGAEVVRFGTTDVELEGGGLVIDFKLKRSPKRIRRIAFSFNELGMWVSYLGAAPPNRDVTSK
jgi:hypothetical protein